jgi:CheY-like chemotaxis protein
MKLPLVEQARHFHLNGLNLLEWAGILFVASTFIYLILRIRDALSADHLKKRKANKIASSLSNKAPRQELKTLPRGEETILVVDDDPGVLRANTRLISKLGYNVQRALGGQEAVDYIKDNHADLIILDLLMPGMDGIETFRNIKQFNPYQKAIVLSGFAGPAMVNSIKTLGVNTYLVKPAEVGILAQAIRDEIERP